MAPEYIGKDTQTGRHTVAFNPAKYRVAEYTAREIGRLAGTGVIFESFGHVNGREHFSRSRYIANEDGSITMYNSDGGRSIIHPADRVIRVLTGK